MSLQLTNVSFIKKLSLIFHRKAYLIYTDNPIPSLLIPLPQTDNTIKSRIYKIFSDLTNNEILTFNNKNLKQKDLNNLERQYKARLKIQDKDLPKNINFENVQNVKINNQSVFLIANGQDGVLEFMKYQKIKDYIKYQMKQQNEKKQKEQSEKKQSKQQVDQLMNVEKQNKRKKQTQQERNQGNIQSPSIDSRKNAGKGYENAPWGKQAQSGKPTMKKPSFGTIEPDGKSQKSCNQESTKLQSQVREKKPYQDLLQRQKQAAKSDILSLDHPPHIMPNQTTNNPDSQPSVKISQTQTVVPPDDKRKEYERDYHNESYFKGYQDPSHKRQKIIPLALLTDYITKKPINIIHIQTSRQYLFLQFLKLFFMMNILCVYQMIKNGTRSQNHQELKKKLIK